MSLVSATLSIRRTFETGWASATAIAWPDTEFTPPEGVSWCRFNLQHNDGYQASMGSPGANKYRREGIVTIQIFSPPGDASRAAQALADAAVAIFKGVTTTDGIHFYDVFPREIGNDPKGMYQINVLAKFRYDDTV